MRAHALTALTAVAMAATCAPAAATVPRQVGSVTWTSQVPGASTGILIDFTFRNPDGANLKPHAVKSMVIRSPAGARIDTSVPPQCHATDAQLLVEGPAGCPADSKVGTAVVDSDTGSTGPFPRYTRTHVTNFNNQDEVIGVGVNDDLPAIKSVDRTKIAGNTSSTTFPVFPGQPPPDPFVAFKHLHIELASYVRDGRPYARTPPRCPAVGYWTIRATFTYHDGVSQSVDSHTPCRRAVRPPAGHGRHRWRPVRSAAGAAARGDGASRRRR